MLYLLGKAAMTGMTCQNSTPMLKVTSLTRYLDGRRLTKNMARSTLKNIQISVIVVG